MAKKPATPANKQGDKKPATPAKKQQRKPRAK